MSLAAATRPRPHPERDGLLVVDAASRTITAGTYGDLADHLAPGDLLVVNDAATLPASLAGTTSRGEAIELRLMAAEADEAFLAVSFGAGDHRTRTEDRDPGPALARGAWLSFAGGLTAAVLDVDPEHARLVRVRFETRDPRVTILHAITRAGKPVQYAHVPDALAPWDVQTIFASRPWAVEIPSAARSFTHALALRVLARGVRITHLTSAAGLTSTGDPAIDRLLPLPERSEIPERTARLVAATRAEGGRVIAVGTSATRALESAFALHGDIRAGAFVSTWKGSQGTPLHVTDGIVTGMHAPPESHHELLRAFADDDLLGQAARRAEELGFLAHELGDSMLILPPRSRAQRHGHGGYGPASGGACSACSGGPPASLGGSGWPVSFAETASGPKIREMLLRRSRIPSGSEHREPQASSSPRRRRRRPAPSSPPRRGSSTTRRADGCP